MTKMLVLGNITSNVFLRSRHAANMQKWRPVLWPVLAKSFSFSSERITVETNTNNDLFSLNLKGRLIAYADDLSLIYFIDPEHLDTLSNEIRQDIDLISGWLRTLDMSLNVTKTEVIHLQRKVRQKYALPQLPFNLQFVSQLKLIGLVYDSRLNFKAYVNELACKITGIATFTMHNKPVNNMGYSFLEESIEAFKGLEKSNCRALIITSSLPRVFCAGLDFNEIVKPEQKRLIKYWKLFEDFITASYSAKFATISAINSVAAAGGCVLALSTDYRIASQQAIIGLNEVAISLPLQEWIFKMCANVTGNRNAEFVSLTGKMFNSEAALRLGLVDEMASDSKELLEKAENQAKVYASLPDIESWYITKMEARKSLVNLIKERKIDSGVFLDSINSPSTQTILGSYASKLKKK